MAEDHKPMIAIGVFLMIAAVVLFAVYGWAAALPVACAAAGLMR